MLDPSFKEKWLKALRSGEYAQCRRTLKRDDSYCCIGVAAVVAGYVIEEENDRITRPDGTSTGGYGVLSDFGLDADARSPLITMNDNDGASFAKIAAYIEEKL